MRIRILFICLFIYLCHCQGIIPLRNSCLRDILGRWFPSFGKVKATKSASPKCQAELNKNYSRSPVVNKWHGFYDLVRGPSWSAFTPRSDARGCVSRVYAIVPNTGRFPQSALLIHSVWKDARGCWSDKWGVGGRAEWCHEEIEISAVLLNQTHATTIEMLEHSAHSREV